MARPSECDEKLATALGFPARAALALETNEQRDTALEVILRNDLNVRQAEELVKRLSAAASEPEPLAPPAPTEIDEQIAAELSRMENSFRAALGTRVELSRNVDGSGRLVVHFYDDEDLQNLHNILIERTDR